MPLISLKTSSPGQLRKAITRIHTVVRVGMAVFR
jgi:hypothetical protein